MRGRLVAAGVAALMVLGGTVAYGAAASQDVACTITDNTLTCPLPAPPAPVTETVTATPVTVTAPAVTVTKTVTAAPTTSTPPATPTTTSSTPTTPTSTTATTTTTPPAGAFPTAATAGVPASWVPATTRSSFTVTTANSVVENMRINGTLTINAANVTVRNVEIIGGGIANFPGATCRNGLVVDTVTIKRGTAATTSGQVEAIGTGGYTARNVKIDGMPEGFRVGGKSSCGPVTIENSYARIVAPDTCGDWHGDGVQGYDGAKVTIRNLTVEFVERSNCHGTAPFFYPHSQGNTAVDIDGLLVSGGGYAFRNGMAGPVKNLNIKRGSWIFGPIDVKCSVVSPWSAFIVDVDANGQPTNKVAQPCNTESGN